MNLAIRISRTYIVCVVVTVKLSVSVLVGASKVLYTETVKVVSWVVVVATSVLVRFYPIEFPGVSANRVYAFPVSRIHFPGGDGVQQPYRPHACEIWEKW